MKINGRTITVSNPDCYLTENSPVDTPTFVKTRTLAVYEQPSDYREVDLDSIEAVRRMAAIRRSSRGNRIDEYVRHGTISIYSPVGHVYKYNGIVALPLTIHNGDKRRVYTFDLMPFQKPRKVERNRSLYYAPFTNDLHSVCKLDYNPENSILKVTFTPDDRFFETYPVAFYKARIFVSLDTFSDGEPIRLGKLLDVDGYFVNSSNKGVGYKLNPLQITEDTIKRMFENIDSLSNGHWSIEKLRRRRIQRGEGNDSKRFCKWSPRWLKRGITPNNYTGVFRIRKRMTNGDYTEWVRFSSYQGEKIRIF